MKSTTIIKGNFATSANNKGNFTAYNATGERIFIAKAMIEKIGIKADADFKPFYAIIQSGTYDILDANNVATGQFTRMEATSIFATETELLQAELADYGMEIRKTVMKRQMLEDAVKSATLDESSVNAILQASSFL